MAIDVQCPVEKMEDQQAIHGMDIEFHARNPASTLLGLPSEIRIKILSFLVGDLYIGLPRWGGNDSSETMADISKCRYESPGWRMSGDGKAQDNPLVILSTCRVIYQELCQVFYQQTMITFPECCHFVRAYHWNAIHPGLPRSQSQVSSNSLSSLSSFRNIQKLSIDLATCSDEIEADQLDTGCGVVVSVMDIVTYKLPQLRHLDLWIERDPRFFRGPRQIAIYFLKLLCRLYRFTVFELYVDAAVMESNLPSYMDDALYGRALQEVIGSRRCYNAERSEYCAEHSTEPWCADYGFNHRLHREIVLVLEQSKQMVSNTTRLIESLKTDIAVTAAEHYQAHEKAMKKVTPTP